MAPLVAKDTKPYGVSDHAWEKLWFDYPAAMQIIYDLSQEPSTHVGDRILNINNIIHYKMILNVEYLAAMCIWRDELLSTTPADPTPTLAPINNITRQIVVCK
jgi:hypothetical protein